MNTQLSVYHNAKNAIAEYKTVDEVKNFRDKALAVEAYAKQANDFELEHDAAIARVRAERKCGELLRDMEKAKGVQGQLQGRDSSGGRVTRPPEDQPKTLSEMGVTKDQSSKWQKLAEVPEAEFEKAINTQGAKPSTNHILKSRQEDSEQKRMNGNSLWLWGTLRDMRKNNLFAVPLSSLTDEWTDAMKEDAESILNQLQKWVNEQ